MPVHPEEGLSNPRRVHPSRGRSIHPEAGLSVPRRAYLSIPRRTYPSRGGPIHPEMGLSVPRRAHSPRGGPVCPKAVLSIPRRALPSRGGPTLPEAGLSIPRRAYPSRGGPTKRLPSHGPSGDTTPCKVTPVILHGVVSPDFTWGCIPRVPARRSHTVDYEGFAPPPIWGGNVTRFILQKASKSIASGQVDF